MKKLDSSGKGKERNMNFQKNLKTKMKKEFKKKTERILKLNGTDKEVKGILEIIGKITIKLSPFVQLMVVEKKKWLDWFKTKLRNDVESKKDEKRKFRLGGNL